MATIMKVVPRRVGSRLSLTQQMSRTPKFRGRQLALKAYSPRGQILRASEVVRKQPQTIEKLGFKVDSLRTPQIIIPKMIEISDKISIMKDEVTVGLFKQVMDGYEITGHNAEELQAVLADSSQAGKALTYVSLLDSREFAKRLSDLTGRKFRIQTEEEWLTARDRLSGDNWTWTEPKYGESTFVLRHLSLVFRISDYPGPRYSSFAFRLVEER